MSEKGGCEMITNKYNFVLFTFFSLLAIALFTANATFSLVSAANNSTMHLACVSSTCTMINGSGNNECSTAGASCNSSTHLVCMNNACVSVTGSGQNECTSSSQCGGNQTTHLTCMNNACTRVSGTGNDTCSGVGSYCGNATHMACDFVHYTCAIVTGPGNSTCSSDAQCGHNKCDYVNKTCTRVYGPGADECSLGERCMTANLSKTYNLTRLSLSPTELKTLPQCNSWFKRTLFNRAACKKLANGEAA
jgi:hypothetical protein